MNDEYESKVLKLAALRIIDEISIHNEIDLKNIKLRREEIVYDIAQRIYTQSGHKLSFSTIRDLLNDQIKSLEKELETNKKYINHSTQEESQEDKQRAEVKESQISQNAGKFGGNEEKTKIFLIVRRIISEHLGIEADEVNLDCHLPNHLGADDLDLVELNMAIEEEFGVEISDEISGSRLGISPSFSFSSWGSSSSPSSSCGAGPECVVRNFVDLIYEVTVA